MYLCYNREQNQKFSIFKIVKRQPSPTVSFILCALLIFLMYFVSYVSYFYIINYFSKIIKRKYEEIQLIFIFFDIFKRLHKLIGNN